MSTGAIGQQKTIIAYSESAIFRFHLKNLPEIDKLDSDKIPFKVVAGELFSLVMIVTAVIFYIDAVNNWISDDWARKVLQNDPSIVYYSSSSVIILVFTLIAFILYHYVRRCHVELTDGDFVKNVSARIANDIAVQSPQRGSVDVERREKMNTGSFDDNVAIDVFDVSSMKIGEARTITDVNRPRLDESERAFLDNLIKEAKLLYPKPNKAKFMRTPVQ